MKKSRFFTYKVPTDNRSFLEDRGVRNLAWGLDRSWGITFTKDDVRQIHKTMNGESVTIQGVIITRHND